MCFRLGFLSLISFSAAFAQSPLGVVTGLVTDPSNAAVPNAELTLTHTKTSVKQTAHTNASGSYSFPNLTPGVYRLTGAAAGFKNFETAEFPVDAYRTVRQDLKLELGAAATEVTVAATTSTVLQVDNPSITAGLTTRQLLDLPTNLRTIYSNAGDSGLISARCLKKSPEWPATSAGTFQKPLARRKKIYFPA